MSLEPEAQTTFMVCAPGHVTGGFVFHLWMWAWCFTCRRDLWWRRIPSV